MYEKIQVTIGDALMELAGGQLRRVEFDGYQLAQTPETVVSDDSAYREVRTQTLYKTADCRYVVHESIRTTFHPSRERIERRLFEIRRADLKPGGRYADLGALSEFGEIALTLDEALVIERARTADARRLREDSDRQARRRRAALNRQAGMRKWKRVC